MISKEVYFDTNVYTHIYKAINGAASKECGGISNFDVQQLAKLVKSDKLRIVASHTNIEEVISAYLTVASEVLGKMKLIGKLANRKRLIKPHPNLATEIIVAFALGTKQQSPYTSIPFELRQMLVPPIKFKDEQVREMAIKTLEQIQRIRESHESLYSGIREKAKEIKGTDQQPSFEDYWREHQLPVTELLANNCRVLDECRNRGIEGLAEIRIVRIAAYSIISHGYANLFERESVKRGDSRDMQHALCSAVTGLFVTHDSQLKKALCRIRFPDYSVMSLRELLQNYS